MPKRGDVSSQIKIIQQQGKQRFFCLPCFIGKDVVDFLLAQE